MRRAPLFVVVAAAGVLGLTGCSNAVEGLAEGAVERAIEDELGEDAEVDISDDGLTVDTEEGSVTSGAGSVPEGFPADVPLADGEVSFGQRLETAEGLSWTVVITTTADALELSDQVRADLEANGFQVENATSFADDSGSGSTILGEKPPLTALVLVTSDGTQTNATYTVNEVAQ